MLLTVAYQPRANYILLAAVLKNNYHLASEVLDADICWYVSELFNVLQLTSLATYGKLESCLSRAPLH